MSYSFSAQGDTKDEALADATHKYDQMVEQQPCHEHDREAALANLRAHLALVDEPKQGECITISMHGSVGYYATTESDPVRWRNSSGGVSVYVGAKV